MQFPLLVFCVVATCAYGFAPSSSARAVRRSSLAPLQENFFIDLPTLNDPSKITPKLLNGEETYKNFVGSYDKDALLLGGGGGGSNYNVITRVRELKLLSATVNSGLLEALEEKGVTLTQLERLLPILDNAGALPLLVKNKELIVGLLPLLVEPAPALLPVLAGIIKTPASTYTATAAALVALGGYEGIADGNFILAGLLTVLSAPLGILGVVLGAISTPLPAVTTAIVSRAAPEVRDTRPKGGRPLAKKRADSAPARAAPTQIKAAKTVGDKGTKIKTRAPIAKKESISLPFAYVFNGENTNGKRKVVRIN